MSGFRTKKALGQNFISDPGIISAIADASGVGSEDTVVEIGPGLGALTCELAERATKVIAVELDASVIPLLRGNLAGASNVEIVNEDILKFDWGKTIAEGVNDNKVLAQNGSGVNLSEAKDLTKKADAVSECIEQPACLRIVGNLPYYITTPILLGILEKGVPAKSITVMVQKEVAERIAAKPGCKDYGVLSISLQYYAECRKVLDVPAEYFTPRPKVDSAVVHMVLKGERLLEPQEEEQFFALVKTAFSQRRKTLLNSLTGFSISNKTDKLSKNDVQSLLENAEIDSQRRPETLSIEEFARLSWTISGENFR